MFPLIAKLNVHLTQVFLPFIICYKYLLKKSKIFFSSVIIVAYFFIYCNRLLCLSKTLVLDILQNCRHLLFNGHYRT